MDCSKCNLRYNTSKRRPKVNLCGHTICQFCCSKLSLCPTCNVALDKGKMTLNHSLIQMLAEKKVSRDIDKLIKVCFVGQSKVGKTSLINRMKGASYNQNTVTTIGYDFAFEDRQIDGLQIRFQLWDSAGQQRFRAVSPLHYKNSDIIVIVYDMTLSGKMNNISHWLQEANRHSPQGSIKILVGNKIDLLESRNNIKPLNSLDEITWKAVASDKIKNYQISCKTYEGIEQFWSIIEGVVRTILSRVFIKHSPFKQTGLKQTKKPKTPRDIKNNTKLRRSTEKDYKSKQSFCC